MTDFNRRLTNDIVNHAMHRIGTILSDSVDLLPDQEAVIQLYATVLAQAMASLSHGLASENHPLFAKLRMAHRCSVLSTHVAFALDPLDPTTPENTTPQVISDLFAASRETKKHFNFRIVIDDTD
jgi:hypothetical protein